MTPKPIYSLENSAVDAASYIGTNWHSGGDLNQTFAIWDVNVALATQASIIAHLSATSTGSTPFATLAVGNAGATLAAGVDYNFTVIAKASTYCNFQVTATVTVEKFYCVQRKVW